MPIDPSIALNVKAPQLNDPLAATEKVMGLKGLMQASQLQDAQIEGVKAATEERREGVRQQQVMNEAVKSATTIGPDGKVFTDEDEIEKMLASRGAAKALIQFQKDRFDREKSRLEAEDQKYKNGKSALQLAANMLQGVSDEQSYQAAKTFITQMNPQLGSKMAPGYDPDTVAQYVLMGMETKDYMDAEHQKVLDRLKTMEQKPKDLDAWAGAAGRYLSMATDQTDWDNRKKSLRSQGAPDDVLAMFDEVYSPASAARAATTAVSPEKRAEIEERMRPRPGIDEPYDPETFKQLLQLKEAGGAADIEDSLQTDIKDTAIGIKDGDIPPPNTESRPTRYSIALTGELKRMGFNLTTARQEWTSAMRYIASADGATQLRLRQALEKIPPHTRLIKQLYNEWKNTNLPTGYSAWNYLALKAAAAVPGKPGSIARNLVAQINDLDAELGQIYMGGNTPTDHALEMAAANLKSEWNEVTFTDALDLIDNNTIMRRNAVRFTGPTGVRLDSPYFPQQANPEKAEEYNRNTDGLPLGEGKTLDKDTAKKFLDAADGDKEKARRSAIAHGWIIR